MEQQDSNTPTPTRGQPLTLGDRTLYLRYSLKTRRELMELFGDDPSKENLRAIAGDKLADILLLGVKRSAPDITREWLEEEVDMENLQEVVQVLSRAMGKKSATVLSITPAEESSTGEAPPASE